MNAGTYLLAAPVIVAGLALARAYFRRRSARRRASESAAPGRKVIVMNLVDRNR
jgi:hypothetical protein